MPAVVRKKYDDCMREFWLECKRVADLAFVAYCRNPIEKLYLVGRKKAGLDTLNPHSFIWSEFRLASESEDFRDHGWHLVIQEHIPRNMGDTEVPYWIQERLRREPIWIFAD